MPEWYVIFEGVDGEPPREQVLPQLNRHRYQLLT
jgi:hypothetical protein